MEPIQAIYGFETRQDGQATQFVYLMEKYQIRHIRHAFLGIALLSLMSLIFVQPRSFQSAFMVFVIAFALLTYLILFLVNINRKQRQFRITKESIELEGKSYRIAELKGIYFQQGKSTPLPSVHGGNSTVIVGGSVTKSIMASSAVNLGNQMGRTLDYAGAKFQNTLATLNCKVLIQYGNKMVVLAKGLSAETADLMINKINETIKTA